MKTNIVAIDLFCGAGGVTRGLLDAGIDVIAGFDIDPSAKRVYEENNVRPNGKKAEYIQRSITELTKKDIIKIIGSKSKRRQEKTKFLLAGCAPCQPFSMKNKNRGDKTDDRRTLITYFANLIRDTQPDFVFMENVAGLEKFEPENFEYFLEILRKGKYSFEKKVVNALNYGVPQNRRRFVLLASKKNGVTIPPGEYDGVSKSYKTVGDTIKNLEPIEAGESHPIIPNHKAANLLPINKKRLKYRNRLEWPKELWLECHKKTSGHTDTYGRMAWDKPSPTLTTKFFSFTTGRYGHPEQNRAISLREGALLQTFPANYIFFDSSIQKVARQVGNAVPPKMAEAFGRYFTSIIK